MAAGGDKIAEAKKLLKSGKKLAKGSFFSKANPEEGEKQLNQARVKLRQVRPPTEESTKLLLEALEALGETRYEMNLFLAAAQALEEAARVVEKNIGETHPSIADYFKQASIYWRMNKQYEKACDAMLLAAKSTGNNDDINGAIEIYSDCCNIEEEEKRYQMSHKYFDAAVKFCIEKKRYKDAKGFLERQNTQYENDLNLFMKRVFRNIAAFIVIECHLKSVKTAQQRYYEAMEKYGDHSRSEERKLCEQLLTAFERADEAQLEAIKKSGDLGLYLLNAVARLAQQLNMIDIQPMEMPVLDSKAKNEIAEEAKADIGDDVLQSEATNAVTDEVTGAPDLLG